MKTDFIRTCAVVALLNSSVWAANGYLDSGDQLGKIQVGKTRSQQVTELLGPPANVQKFSRRGVEAWAYFVRGAEFSIEIDSAGVVRSVERVVHYGP